MPEPIDTEAIKARLAKVEEACFYCSGISCGTEAIQEMIMADHENHQDVARLLGVVERVKTYCVEVKAGLAASDELYDQGCSACIGDILAIVSPESDPKNVEVGS